MSKSAINIYFFILFAAMQFVACRQKSERTTFGEVCAKGNQARVELEGYLRLPGAPNAEMIPAPSFGYLLLVEKSNGTGAFLYALVGKGNAREPNRMRELPASYTYADFHVFADDGAEILSDERVKVTGEVIKEKNLCVLKIGKIETP